MEIEEYEKTLKGKNIYIEILEEELKLAITLLDNYDVDWEYCKELYLGDGILSKGE